MKMNLCRGQAVNLSLRLRDALKDRDGLLFHPRREFALADEMLDLGEAALFVMAMFVVLVMLLAVRVVVAVVLFAVMVRMRVGVTGFMLVTMRVREMHVKLHPFDGGLVLARDVEMVAVELELAEFAFEFVRVHAQINQRANEHVAADAAENVEIKGFHFVPRLIVFFLHIQATNHPVGRLGERLRLRRVS